MHLFGGVTPLQAILVLDNYLGGRVGDQNSLNLLLEILVVQEEHTFDGIADLIQNSWGNISEAIRRKLLPQGECSLRECSVLGREVEE